MKRTIPIKPKERKRIHSLRARNTQKQSKAFEKKKS